MINVLVTHKRENLGIGCINRVLKKHVVVNWGLYGASKHLPQALNVIDTKNCKTVSLDNLKEVSLKNEPLTVIVGNELRQYVGIGWTVLRVINFDDLDKYPRLV